MAAGWTAFSYLISGPLLYGGLGWLVDRWLDTEVFVVIGLLAGMALSLYMIYLRYVRPEPPASAKAGDHRWHHRHGEQDPPAPQHSP